MDAPADNVLRFRVQVQPRARRAEFAGRYGDALKVHVKAPPVDGAANEAVIELVAAALAVPRRAVRIAHGLRGRNKLVEVVCDDVLDCRRRLTEIADGPTVVDIERVRG